MIKVTPIPTGTAELKFAQQCGADGRSALQRKLDIFLDRRWVGPWPILCWLIEHPEGRFIVDTGDTSRNSVPGYLPRWNPFFTKVPSVTPRSMGRVGRAMLKRSSASAISLSAISE